MPNRNFSFGFALILSLIWNAAALASEAPITAVTLYPGSATVERTAQVTPAMKRLEIQGLLANFDPQTIRIQSDAGIHIGQIVTQDFGRSAAANAREAELELKIQTLQDQQAMFEVDAKTATLLQNYLEHFSSAAEKDKQQPYIDAKSLTGVLSTIRVTATEAFKTKQRVEVQNRETGKTIEALQRDLRRIRSGAIDVRNVTVNLKAERAGTIKLTYQVTGAGWKPTYRATLDSVTSMVEFERLATISQKSGEDWAQVKLRLSTGQPRLSPQAPDPISWFLAYRKGPVASYLTADRVGQGAGLLKSKALSSASVADASDNYAAPMLEEQGAFATEFEVPARVDLPADGREISVALSKLTVPVKQRVRIAPRINNAAVVTAEADRPNGVWLTGNMQLFRDGSYVGVTLWNPQSSQRFVFPFGRDDLTQLMVKRTTDQFNTTGVISRRSERKVSDLYTLTSFHKAPIEIELFESSPVSTSDEIKVQAAYNPLPTIENWEQRQGVVVWEKTLAPNETLKFGVEYIIVYPQEGEVTGLP